MQKKRTFIPNPLRRLKIQGRLMLLLCGVSLLVLALVWVLCATMLQPRFNRYIETSLTAQLDTMAGLMDDAIANGETLSRRFGRLELNRRFWGAGGPVDEALHSGALVLDNCCLDIADNTGRAVTYVENLYPCLLHDSAGVHFGADSTFSRDSAEAIRLRTLCAAEGSLSTVMETASGARQMVVGRTTADGSYTILISASIARVDEAGVVLGRMLPAIAAAIFLFSVLAAWAFSHWFTRPLRRLSAAARRMAEGDYDVQVPVGDHTDELSLLAGDFNQMAGAVKRAAQSQQELLANVSHDLRTPLTLIRGYAETVRDISGEDRARRDEQMNIIIDETDRLSALVNSVMELTKVTSGVERCVPVRFDLAQLCEEVAERYEAVCARVDRELRLELPPDTPLPVEADPALLERVLHNLLGNAMSHLGPDGVFILRARPLPEGIRVEVEDHGAGIAAEDLPYIFDRYYRSRRDAGQPGAGLGLSITKAIFRLHGFPFGVESTPGKGTRFWFVVAPVKG